MADTITPEERQSWISKYKRAHGELDKLYGALEFLSGITDADCAQSLEMNAEQRSGLSALLSILANQLADNLYERMPYPKDFAELCGKEGRQ